MNVISRKRSLQVFPILDTHGEETPVVAFNLNFYHNEKEIVVKRSVLLYNGTNSKIQLWAHEKKDLGLDSTK